MTFGYRALGGIFSGAEILIEAILLMCSALFTFFSPTCASIDGRLHETPAVHAVEKVEGEKNA